MAMLQPEPHLHTNFGTTALIWTAAPGCTGVPAFVTTRPSTWTLPWTIHDWMTFRASAGRSSRHTSSSRRRLPLLTAGAAACKPFQARCS